MKLDREYQLVFFAKNDLNELLTELTGADEIDEFKPFFILKRQGRAIAAAVVEEGERERLIKILNADGDVKTYIAYCGEKIVIRERAFV